MSKPKPVFSVTYHGAEGDQFAIIVSGTYGGPLTLDVRDKNGGGSTIHEDVPKGEGGHTYE